MSPNSYHDLPIYFPAFPPFFSFIFLCMLVMGLSAMALCACTRISGQRHDTHLRSIVALGAGRVGWKPSPLPLFLSLLCFSSPPSLGCRHCPFFSSLPLLLPLLSLSFCSSSSPPLAPFSCEVSFPSLLSFCFGHNDGVFVCISPYFSV